MTVTLEPLEVAVAQELIGRLLGVIPPEQLWSVLAKVEGNPFFLEEVLGSLIDQGLLERRNAGWAMSELPEGFVIPDTVQEKPQEGEVISIGPGAIDEKTGKRTPLEVKAGDHVLFGKWSGSEVKLDGEELLIMKESDIMGVLS